MISTSPIDHSNRRHLTTSLYIEGQAIAPIVHVESQQYVINQSYQFQLRLQSAHPLNIQSTVGKPAYFTFSTTHMHGYIGQASYLNQDLNGYHYRYRLLSPLHALHTAKKHRIFLDQSPSQLIKIILFNNGWTIDQIQFNLKHEELILPSMTQFEETDFEFLKRLINENGIFFHFVQRKTQYCLSLTDDLANLSPTQTHHPITVMRYHKNQHLLPEFTKIRVTSPDYPAHADHVQCEKIVAIPAYGCIYADDAFQTTKTLASRQAKLYRDHLDAQRQLCHVSTVQMDLKLGELLHIAHPITPFWEQPFRLIGIRYLGLPDGNANVNKLNWQAELTLLPINTPYAIHSTHPHPMKPMSNFHLGKIQAAPPDTKGRYAIHLPHISAPYNKYHHIPFAQLFTGYQAGMHCRLHKDTTILCAFRHGNSEYPFILGCLFDENCPSPITDHNNQWHCFRTQAGHGLSFCDQIDSSSIILETTNGQQTLKLRPKTTRLSNKTGSLHLASLGHMRIHSQTSYIQTVKKKYALYIDQHYRLTTKQGDIVGVFKEECFFNAKRNLLIQSQRINQWHSGGNLQLEAVNRSEWNAKHHLHCRGQQSIHLKAKQAITFNNHVINIVAGNSRLIINGNQALIQAALIQIVSG